MTTALIKSNDTTPFGVDITVSDFDLRGDEPLQDGGQNTGPAPYDFLVTALGTCTVMTIQWYAKKEGWSLDHVSASITYQRINGAHHFTKAISIEGSALTEDQRQKLFDISQKCPVQKTLTSDVEITTDWMG